jgi:DNA modification methylase
VQKKSFFFRNDVLGTTAIAALMNERDYIGIELSKQYCEMAENRIAAYNEGLYYEQRG